MKTFFKKIRNNLYNPLFERELIRNIWHFGVRTALGLVLLFILLGGALLWYAWHTRDIAAQVNTSAEPLNEKLLQSMTKTITKRALLMDSLRGSTADLVDPTKAAK